MNNKIMNTAEKVFNALFNQQVSKEIGIKIIEKYGSYRQKQGEVLNKWRDPDYKMINSAILDIYVLLTDLLETIKGDQNEKSF